MESPVEFLRRYKIPYSLKRQKAILATCPFCAGDKTFTIHIITGKWQCSSCKESGNLYQLKVALGYVKPLSAIIDSLRLKPVTETDINHIEESHKRLLQSPELLKELIEWRCITEDVIKKFKLGYYEDKNKAYLVIPHFFKEKCYNAKLRSWVGYEKEFIRIPGQPTIIFNADVLLNAPKRVILTEAEGDALCAISCGFENTVSLTAGAKSGIPPQFIELFDPVEEIIIAFDGDDAGRIGAQQAAKQLGVHKCSIVDFGDGYDLTDYVKTFGNDALVELLNKAQPAPVGDVEDLYSVLERLAASPFIDEIYSTGFENLDRIIGGYYPYGFLVTIAGQPKSGKTTFACLLAEHFVVKYGPALIFCLEMEKERIANIIRSQVLLSSRRPSVYESYLAKAVSPLNELYLAYMSNADINTVIETIRESFYRFGVRFVVFDNVNYLVRHTDNKASKTADVIKDFALLAKEIGIVIILIAQPRKLGRDTREMTGDDIAWSSAFRSDSDVLLIINRNKIGTELATYSPVLKVTADATRDASGGTCYFVMDKFSACIFETDENPIKGDLEGE